MATRTGMVMRLYLHGYDIGGDVSGFGPIAARANLIDVTSVQDSATRRLVGKRDGEITFTCFFNDTADASHDALSTLPTTDVLAMVTAGITRGDPVFCLSAKQVNYDWNVNQDGSLTGTVQLVGAAGYPLETARLLTAKVTHSSATDVTGIDHGAQTTSGGVGYLQHFAAASGTVEYDIEDSSDSTNGTDGTWGNLLAFSDVATPYAQIAQRVEVSGTVERWVRASTNGTFTNAQFAMAFRRRVANEFDAG